MCTAITFQSKHHYFGRNLDLEYRYQEAVTVTPRCYPFHFSGETDAPRHYAIIGMATVVDGYPLYYDATNEHGLSMAGLNFPGNAVYGDPRDEMAHVAPYELIPWVLGSCENLEDARAILARTDIVNRAFSQEYPVTPLHWLISDPSGSLTVESTLAGIQVYDNPVGVLTNNPPFPYHLQNLCNYRNLTREQPQSRFATGLTLEAFSRGMGAIGLPGDLSSPSRFIRAAFTKWNSVCDPGESDSVSQFFHILDSVKQTRGCAAVGDGYEITLYQSCCNTDKGIYYYRTYQNSSICAVDLFREALDGQLLAIYPLVEDLQIHHLNGN